MTALSSEVRGFRATMILCNYAVVTEGLLHINGGGWTTIDSRMAQSAIALIIGVPWNETNRPINFRLELHNEDGHPQRQVGNESENPVEIDGQFEVGRPAGYPPGQHVDWKIALLIPPLQLPPAGRFLWALSIDGRSSADWVAPFFTRPVST